MLAPDAPSFGAGAAEPYAHALRGTADALRLHEVPSDGRAPAADGRLLDVQRYLGPADAVDAALLHGAPGPLLDVGCGPGRMVRAAAAAGVAVLGIDVSEAAIRLARSLGSEVLLRSVFDEVPGRGRWGTVLLVDGNIGIGGDPAALLRRCAALVRPEGGRILVETSTDPHLDRAFSGMVTDDRGHRSRPFPWAEVGTAALRRHAAAAGLVPEREWTEAGRSFAEHRRP